LHYFAILYILNFLNAASEIDEFLLLSEL